MSEVVCVCGKAFTARSNRARYCSDRCRKRAQRGGGEVVELPAKVGQVEGSVLAVAGPVVTATFDALKAADRLETPHGAMALSLARRMDLPGLDTGSALAAVSRQLDAVLVVALRGAGVASAPQQLQDELAARRAKHA